MSEETTSRIFCYPSNNSAIETAALMNNNMNSWNNNPFVYLVWMMMMRYLGNGWDGNTGENYNSRQIAALQDTINSNHNNDLVIQAIQGNSTAISELSQTFGTNSALMQNAIAGVKSAIEMVGGQVGFSSERVINSVLLGNKDLTQALQTCCCDNKMLQMQNFSATQLQNSQNQAAIMGRMDQLNTVVQQGFAQIGYQNGQNTNEIVQAGNANTQRIIDLLNNRWYTETSNALQDEKFKNSQLIQTQVLLNAMSTKTTTTAATT